MSAPYSDIETKCEVALVRHLNGIAVATGITIHAGVDPSNLPLPWAVCQATSAAEHIPFSGQYAVDVEIDVSSQADDTTAATHRQRISTVRDELSNNWVGASLNAQGVADFTVVGQSPCWGVILKPSAMTIVDHHWITKIPLTIHCRPS